MFCRPGWPAVAHRDPSASVSSAEIKGINHHAERCLKPPSHTVLSSFYMVSQTLRERERLSPSLQLVYSRGLVWEGEQSIIKEGSILDDLEAC